MIETLLKLGLTEKEAKVYLAALELGSAPASKIAQKSGLNRPTTYVLLEKLSDIGLVTSYDKGKVQFFTAEDPEQLGRLIREQEHDLAERASELKEKLPELKAMFGKTDRPKVLVFDSAEASSEYFYNKLKQNDKIYGFTNYDIISKVGEDKSEPEERLRKKINTSLIYTSKNGPVTGATDPTQLRVAKFIPNADFDIESVITCAPDRDVVIMRNYDPANPDTIIAIEDKRIARSFKAIFNQLWKSL